MQQLADKLREEGKTVVFFARKGGYAGWMALTDTVRDDGTGTVEGIGQAGVGTVLLTGDTEGAAKHIAGKAGISECRANCLPEDKLEYIRHRYGRCGQ